VGQPDARGEPRAVGQRNPDVVERAGQRFNVSVFFACTRVLPAGLKLAVNVTLRRRAPRRRLAPARDSFTFTRALLAVVNTVLPLPSVLPRAASASVSVPGTGAAKLTVNCRVRASLRSRSCFNALAPTSAFSRPATGAGPVQGDGLPGLPQGGRGPGL